MAADNTVLQVLPHLPGSNDGVGDYALTLAKRLAADHSLTTIFAVAGTTSVPEQGDFRLIGGLESVSAADAVHVILHYANYGYQPRGVPFELARFARKLRSQISGRWITTFHELYASGPPWRSAFWLRPFQVRIAREMVSLSSTCVVSNEVIKREIIRHDATKPVRVVPVMSNFGEPPLIESSRKSLRRWAICGGTSLIERSLQTFHQLYRFIPPEFQPGEVEVIGGTASEGVGRQLELLRHALPGTFFRHHPRVGADSASEMLSTCSFGWLDYFGAGKVWPTMIFKSGSFAACCAHGVIPIVSHQEPTLGIGSDTLPGPFFCTAKGCNFPERADVFRIQQSLQSWYQRNASSSHTATVYAEALR